jgi:hypothetical protein
MKRRTVEILFFEGCPHAQDAIDRAREAIRATRQDATVRLVKIRTKQEAVKARFLGSPTIRVDGVDVDSSVQGRSDYGLQCRIYSVDEARVGAPPLTWIEAALSREST